MGFELKVVLSKILELLCWEALSANQIPTAVAFDCVFDTNCRAEESLGIAYEIAQRYVI